MLQFQLYLRVEIDPKTEVPTNRLTEEAIEFCRSVGSKAETVDDIAGVDPTDNTIQEEIKKALQRANEVRSVGIFIMISLSRLRPYFIIIKMCNTYLSKTIRTPHQTRSGSRSSQ